MTKQTRINLDKVLQQHTLFLAGDSNGRRADLSYAKLREANLGGADLSYAKLHYVDLRGAELSYAKLHEASLGGADLHGANLHGTVGNMKEIKTIQAEQFPIVWIQSPDGETIVQIGCQQHTLSYWKYVTKAEISSHGGSWNDWQRLWPHVLALIEASPAVPYGTGKEVE